MAKISDEEVMEKKKKADAITQFFERVTMAGVQDIHRTKIRYEKWMFLLAIVVGWSGAGFNIWNNFKRPDIVYDRFPLINYQPPFPNVSICAPLSVNRSIFEKWLIIPEKTKHLIARKNVSLSELVDYAIDFFRYDVYPRSVDDQLMAVASLQIMDSTVVQFERGYADFLVATFPTCSETLVDCSFDGRPFDCCQYAQFLYVYDRICYQIDINSIPGFQHLPTVSGGEADDPTHIDQTGLEINVTFDFKLASFFDDVAQDGFHVTVNALPFSHSHPIAIPSGADALITIGSTKQVQLTNCRPINRLPKMEFFDYYDSTGELYYYDAGNLHAAVNIAGCDYPLLMHRPSNATYCMPIFFYRLKTNFDNMDVQRKNLKSLSASDVNDQLTKQWRESLPICERWDYEVKTASYGFLYKNNQRVWHSKNQTDERPWSRMRIFFPSASYLLRKEKPSDTPYQAMWRIGGTLTVYIGVSMVGVIQLILYGGIASCSILRKCGKISNSQKSNSK